MKRIAVSLTIVETLRFLCANFGRLVAIGFVPAALYCVLSVPIESLWDLDDETVGNFGASLYFAANAALFLILVPSYVAWHRLALLGPSQRGWLDFARVSRRDVRYGGYTLLMQGLPVLLMVAILMFDKVILPELLSRLIGGLQKAESSLPLYGGVAAFLLFLVVLAWVYLRITFLFVEIAVDARTGLRSAWRRSRGHALGLALIAGIPVAVFAVFGLPYIWVVDGLVDGGPGWTETVSTVLYALLSVIVAAFWIVATSFAYRDVTGWTPDQSLATQAEP